ncbi:MAG: hypothetical protein LQ349_003636 [Xanthoria aureola]|nr:MAG: hypothetical protein LQ349_003636 [Xanthoria aureola]
MSTRSLSSNPPSSRVVPYRNTMPNKYSHASVLSCYETRGLIAPPPAPYSPSESDLYAANGGDDHDAPSPNAVPALSDASTTSTASSPSEPPRQPSHSASSSIVTEIYAPQEFSLDPIRTAYTPTEAIAPEARPASPTSKTPPPPSFPPPPKSRFSSYHDLSPFISKHTSSTKPNSKSHRRHSHLPRTDSPEQPQPSSSIRTSTPRPHSTHQSWLPPPPTTTTTTHQQQPYIPSPSHKRLEPTFDTDSLASLSLSDLETSGRQSPNMDVVPWEYPETHSQKPPPPPVYHPSSLPSRPPPPSSSHSPPPQAPSTNPATPSIRPPEPAIHFNAANQPLKYFPVPRPQRHSMISTTAYTPSRHSDPPSLVLPYQSTPTLPHTLAHRLSAESFDSVAPPPIRITPRAGQHRISVEAPWSHDRGGHAKGTTGR